MTQREFDIVIYGATGFVGKLTAEYLARAGGTARIALAGRSPDKLAAVRASLGEAARDWQILAADASSPSSLEEMAARTRVVLTTVGPYSKYGLPLVGACAKTGTDYADLTGEAMFVRQSIDDYHKQAVDTGVTQDGFVEIRGGLKAGDRVVADGLNRIQDGQPLRIGGGRPGGAAPPPGAQRAPR